MLCLQLYFLSAWAFCPFLDHDDLYSRNCRQIPVKSKNQLPSDHDWIMGGERGCGPQSQSMWSASVIHGPHPFGITEQWHAAIAQFFHLQTKFKNLYRNFSSCGCSPLALKNCQVCWHCKLWQLIRLAHVCLISTLCYLLLYCKIIHRCTFYLSLGQYTFCILRVNWQC